MAGGRTFGGNLLNKEKPKTLEQRLEDLEAKSKQDELEKKELKRKLDLVEEKAKSAEIESGINSGRRDVLHEEMAPYPVSDSRPKYIHIKEREFKKYGVGVNPIRFERVDKDSLGDNIDLIPSSSTVTHQGQVINLVYCRNHESPFEIDHPGGNWMPETDSIIFNRGEITVQPSDPCLQRFLLSHRKYGTKWRVYDEEAISREENAKWEKIDTAALKVAEMFNDEDPNTPRYFAFLVLGPHHSVHDKTEVLKRKLREAVMHNPDLIDYSKKEMKVKYTFAVAHSRGFLIARNKRIYFSDGRPLCELDGLDMHDAFYKYCDRNPAIIQEIKEKVGLR